MAADVNFKTVARITAGFSGAELANLLNEAAILAARKGKKLIGNLELYDGINKVLMGPQKKSRVVTESDKRCTAYHEAGHAVLACLCKHCDPVHEVSIITGEPTEHHTTMFIKSSNIATNITLTIFRRRSSYFKFFKIFPPSRELDRTQSHQKGDIFLFF